MDKKNEIPSGIRKFLTGYHVRKEDILAFAETDMTLEGEFSRGYLVLTKTKLILMTSEPDPTEVYQFKGIGSIHDSYSQKDRAWAVKFIELHVSG